MMETTNNAPWMSGITRDEDYRLQLEALKGQDYSDNGTSIKEIIESLLPEGGCVLYYNHQLNMDCDDCDDYGNKIYLKHVVSGDAEPGYTVHVWIQDDGHETEVLVEVVTE